MDNQAPHQPTEKELLEIQKLKSDIRTVNYNRFAQFFTPISVILSTVIVLIVFQRPQIDQLEATRISNEKIQIGNMLMTVQQIENAQDRKLMLDALKRSWPSYAEIETIAQANQAVAEPLPEQSKISNSKDNSSEIQCAKIKIQHKELSESLGVLNDNINQEVYGINGRKPGEGPFVLALRKQVQEVNKKMRAFERYAVSVGCAL